MQYQVFDKLPNELQEFLKFRDRKHGDIRAFVYPESSFAQQGDLLQGIHAARKQLEQFLAKDRIPASPERVLAFHIASNHGDILKGLVDAASMAKALARMDWNTGKHLIASAYSSGASSIPADVREKYRQVIDWHTKRFKDALSPYGTIQDLSLLYSPTTQYLGSLHPQDVDYEQEPYSHSNHNLSLISALGSRYHGLDLLSCLGYMPPSMAMMAGISRDLTSEQGDIKTGCDSIVAASLPRCQSILQQHQ